MTTSTRRQHPLQARDVPADSPPRSLEAEQGVLGSMLLDRDAIARVVEGVRPENFYRDAHRVIFSAILELFERGEPVDIITVTHRLTAQGKIENAGGATYIASLPNATPTPGNVGHYASIVLERAQRRALLKVGQQLQHDALNGTGVSDTLTQTRALLDAIAGGDVGVGGFEFLTLANLAASVGSDIDWVIRGFLARRHTTLMPGLWKIGKTTLEAHIIKAMEKGGAFCGLPVEPGPVTVVSEEDKSLWAMRRAAVGITGDHVNIVCRPFPKGRPTMEQWTSLIAAVAGHAKEGNHSLVVFDSIHNLWGLTEENDNAEMLRWLSPLATITEAGAALLLAGHPSKADQSEGKITRGGGAIAGFVDIITEFRRYDPADPGNRMRVLTGFSRFEETPAELVVELAGGEYRAVGTKAEVRASQKADEVLELLTAEPPGRTSNDVREAWNGDGKVPGIRTLEGRLNSLVAGGRATRTGSGGRGDPYRFHRAEQ